MKTISHSKVNLFLRVLGRRPDNYHDIEAVVQTISLHDLVTFEPVRSGIEVTVSGPAAQGVPEGAANLCYKAATALFKELDLDQGIRIHLKKMVPAGAGLGGGSGNAARTLTALNHLFSLGLSQQELCHFGASVGSDVPALIVGGAVLATGRGEKVQNLGIIPMLYFLIIKPDFACRTETIYRLWDEAGRTGSVDVEEAIRALERLDLVALREMELNDLEAVAFKQNPQLAELKKALLDANAGVALLCGSGSAVMGIYSSQEVRDAAWFELRRPGWQVFRAESVLKDQFIGSYQE
jgi:4-diphosphocytidyl-2-C-methyl-D-erythritol kinase